MGRKYSDAKIRAAELEAETVALFQRLRDQEAGEQSADEAIEAYLKKPPATRLQSLDAGRPGLSSQLASLYLQSLDSDSTARSNGERWVSADEPNSLTGELQVVLETIKKAVVTGDVTSFFPVIELLTEWRGYRLVDNSGEDLQRLTYDFLRAAQQGCRVLLARQRGEFADADLPASEPLPASWERKGKHTSRVPKKSSLSDVTEIYARRLSTVNVKTQGTNLSWWQKLVEHCRDKPLEEVTQKDIYGFLEARLNDNVKPWSMEYEGKVLSGLKVAFALAQANGMCSHNPAAQLVMMPKISAGEEKKRRKPRLAYSVKQLNILFSSSWYDPAATDWQGRMKWDLGARYWVPLLCLYHGFRVREALQLRGSDILAGKCSLIKLQVDDTEEGDEKADTLMPERTLKNEAAKRTVPFTPFCLDWASLNLSRLQPSIMGLGRLCSLRRSLNAPAKSPNGVGRTNSDLFRMLETFLASVADTEIIASGTYWRTECVTPS